MASFAELTKQVHVIDELILSDMVCGKDGCTEEEMEFSKHLLSTKYWFSRISWANKKNFLLALLKNVKSVWALSLLLKSIWNCRPKDAVMSVSERNIWSSYDQVPMDYNRTAQPLTMLTEVMLDERKWFLTLDPECQALVMSELLTVAGGPLMWEVLRYAQTLYEGYLEEQLQCLQECAVVVEPEKTKPTVIAEQQTKKEQTPRRKSSILQGVEPARPLPTGQSQKELEANLASWASTMKAMRDNMKLEELEMTFQDGSKRKIWKVNRPKPEAIETVDFIQLLPSTISKRIFMFIPSNQLGEYARVNKYWAYLVDEIRAEISARQKINSELEKMRDNMLKHDVGLDLASRSDFNTFFSSVTSTLKTIKNKEHVHTFVSYKSLGYSLRQMMSKEAKKPIIVQKPVHNMTELYERLDRRGAADESIWKWCSNVLRIYNKNKTVTEDNETAGLMMFGNIHFPCPLMLFKIKVPLDGPLTKDPTKDKTAKYLKNVKNVTIENVNEETTNKHRCSIWMKDFSRLYPVSKIASHQF